MASCECVGCRTKHHTPGKCELPAFTFARCLDALDHPSIALCSECLVYGGMNWLDLPLSDDDKDAGYTIEIRWKKK